MSDTINITTEKWECLCSKIDNEGFGYFVMDYIAPDGFSEYVDGDERAVQLFKEAKDSMLALRSYLRLNDF